MSTLIAEKLSIVVNSNGRGRAIYRVYRRGLIFAYVYKSYSDSISANLESRRRRSRQASKDDSRRRDSLSPLFVRGYCLIRK